MTRTAVRRHVDVSDGRLVIRKIVVETSQCRGAAPADEPVVAVPGASEQSRGRRARCLQPGMYLVRVRKTHLI
jgi:hypothetical protein